MKNFIGLIFVIILLSACGGSGGGGGSTAVVDLNTEDGDITPVDVNAENTVENAVVRNTQDVLADPSATFKTFKKVDFIASNESDLNVTLFIYDNLQDLVARHYIESQELTVATIQLPMAGQAITLHWHYREQVKKHEVNVADLASLSFTGFD